MNVFTLDPPIRIAAHRTLRSGKHLHCVSVPLKCPVKAGDNGFRPTDIGHGIGAGMSDEIQYWLSE